MKNSSALSGGNRNPRINERQNANASPSVVNEVSTLLEEFKFHSSLCGAALRKWNRSFNCVCRLPPFSVIFHEKRDKNIARNLKRQESPRGHQSFVIYTEINFRSLRAFKKVFSKSLPTLIFDVIKRNDKCLGGVSAVSPVLWVPPRQGGRSKLISLLLRLLFSPRQQR